MALSLKCCFVVCIIIVSIRAPVALLAHVSAQCGSLASTERHVSVKCFRCSLAPVLSFLVPSVQLPDELYLEWNFPWLLFVCLFIHSSMTIKLLLRIFVGMYWRASERARSFCKALHFDLCLFQRRIINQHRI